MLIIFDFPCMPNFNIRNSLFVKMTNLKIKSVDTGNRVFKLNYSFYLYTEFSKKKSSSTN